MSQSIADVPAFLRGHWSVDRVIYDGVGTYSGAATFIDDGAGGVRWHEAGRLTLGAYTGDTYRDLLIVPREPWEVRFDDGRLFHVLDLRDGHCEPRHPCGPDVYDGVYEVADNARFTVTWHVTGPGRDDTIVSDYYRRRR